MLYRHAEAAVVTLPEGLMRDGQRSSFVIMNEGEKSTRFLQLTAYTVYNNITREECSRSLCNKRKLLVHYELFTRMSAWILGIYTLRRHVFYLKKRNVTSRWHVAVFKYSNCWFFLVSHLACAAFGLGSSGLFGQVARISALIGTDLGLDSYKL